MDLGTFGLAFERPATAPAIVFPPVDKNGNVHWVECNEGGCTARSLPEPKKGGAWWAWKLEHVAKVHPDRDPHTIKWYGVPGHKDSHDMTHCGGPPSVYLEGRLTKVRTKAYRPRDRDEDDDQGEPLILA